jgi:uncharacterized protein
MTQSRSTKVLLLALVILVAVTSWLLGSRSVIGPASAEAATQPDSDVRNTVLVSATGEVLGVPDTLRAAFGASASAPTVDEALNLANAAMKRMQEALVQRGVASADVQTSNASIRPTADEQGKITGYAVNEGLSAWIRTISEAGTIIAEAIAAGGDAARLVGVSFDVEEDDDLVAAARRQAFAAAQAKAELYAAEAGRTLGPVVNVTETIPGYGPVGRDEALAGSAASAVPIEPGRQQLAVTVTVEWSFR